VTPERAEQRQMPPAVRWPVAALRHRIEITTGELTERLGLTHYSVTTV